MQRIKKLSRFMLFALNITIGIAAVLGGYLALNPSSALMHFSDSGILVPALQAWQNLGLAGLILLNTLAVLYVLWQFRKLFSHFSHGEVFSMATTKCIYQAAKGLFVKLVITILNTSIAVLIITANAADGEHALVFSLSSSDAALFLAAMILLAMSWVMQEAANLSDENARFI